MNISTPFTCTEIIAHMKTLKYLALASKKKKKEKISVGAEDNNNKMSSFYEGILGATLQTDLFLVDIRLILFLYVGFFFLFQGLSCM